MHVAGATPLPGRSTRMIAAAYSCVHVRSADFCKGDTHKGDTDTKKMKKKGEARTPFTLNVRLKRKMDRPYLL